MSDGEDDLGAQDNDGAQDELRPGEVIEAELGRLGRHPRAEVARLKRVAEEGESGSTPFIEMALVAARLVPLVALVIGVVLFIYLKI